MPESRNRKRATRSSRTKAQAKPDLSPADPQASSEAPDAIEEPEESAGQELALPELDIAEVAHRAAPGGPGGNGHRSESGVKTILYDQEFLDRMITKMVANVPIDPMAEEIINRLSEALQENAEFRGRLIDAVMQNERQRGRMVRAIIKSLD